MAPNLSHLRFGKTDAKNEILSRNSESRDFFLQSFTMPNVNIISELFGGDRFLVYGPKGVGKTALLRYLSATKLQQGNPCKFILFSDDISEQQRQEFLSTNNVLLEEIERDFTANDVKQEWKLYIFSRLVDLINENPHLSNPSPALQNLTSLFKSIENSTGISRTDRLKRFLRSSEITLAANIKDYFQVKLTRASGTDDKQFINVDAVLDVIKAELCNVELPEDISYYLFIDELNLSMVSKRQHKRDSILIRDLILATGSINSFFSEKSLNLFVYAAIRDEIVASRNVAQNEINKLLNDNGIPIAWHGDNNIEKYKILDLIVKKIQTSEKNVGYPISDPSDIWKKYFSKDVFGIDPRIFIAEVTWCNPRDIVQLLGEMTIDNPTLRVINTDAFARHLDKYSRYAWEERAESLSAEYSQTEINAIKRILSGFRETFRMEQIKKYAEDRAKTDQTAMQLLKTKTLKNILEDLYLVGIIGQSFSNGKSTRDDGRNVNTFSEVWFYKKKEEFDVSRFMVVHRALRHELSLGKIRRDCFEIEANYANI